MGSCALPSLTIYIQGVTKVTQNLGMIILWLQIILLNIVAHFSANFCFNFSFNFSFYVSTLMFYMYIPFIILIWCNFCHTLYIKREKAIVNQSSLQSAQ